MKKSLRIICLFSAALLTVAGMNLLHRFPIDTQPYVEKKYNSWNGVLQAWICARWNPGGSFIRWLNSRAADFEKDHSGVYIELTPVTMETIREMDSCVRIPDLIFFSPGVVSNSDILVDLETPKGLRSDLQNYGSCRAIPIALSGYIWAYNTSLIEDVPRKIDEATSLTLPEDADGQSFSAAVIGLLSDTPGGREGESVLPDAGLDLGLPASALGVTLYSTDALDAFIDSELPFIPVDAKILSQLNRLQENGKGPDWKITASGEMACTDQVLLAAVPKQDFKPERTALSEEFISVLLTQEAQAALADIGAFSVIGERIHSDFSSFAEMDVLLNSRPLYLPDCFSEYSAPNPETIVRRFLNGEISAKNALSLLGFEEV